MPAPTRAPSMASSAPRRPRPSTPISPAIADAPGPARPSYPSAGRADPALDGTPLGVLAAALERVGLGKLPGDAPSRAVSAGAARHRAAGVAKPHLDAAIG